jgi:putative ABC transport system permease protein
MSFTLGIVVLSALISGVAPAAASSWPALNHVMRSGGRGSTGSAHGRLRNAMIVAEVALSLVLLTGAGLLGKSFVALMNVQPGFEARHVLTTKLSLPRVLYKTTAQAAAFYDTLLARVRELPGVETAAVTDTVPLSGDDNSTGIEFLGRQRKPGEIWNLHPRIVSGDYLEAMRIAPIEGRMFNPQDEAGPQRVAILSQNAARQYFPGESAVGKRFAFFAPGNPPYEIVGIAAPVHNSALDREVSADVYLPIRSNPFPFPLTSVALVVRTAQDPIALAQGVRGAIASLDRSLPISSIRSMEDYVEASVAPRKFNLVLLGILAAIALALSAAGLYGVMVYLVTQRTAEIGIRMALGARGADVLRLVVGKGLLLAGGGVALGLVASLAAARVMDTLLYGVQPRDPVIFAVVPVFLLGVAMLASYIPARRASRMDPMTALRME